MDWFLNSDRYARVTWRVTILPLIAVSIFLASVGWDFPDALAQFQLPNRGRIIETEQDPLAGVYLPTDRALSRAVARARERLASREYHESLTFLQDILSREEDSFLELLDGERTQVGLKATARRLIGELPSDGSDVYELLHGATARRQLEAALQSGNQENVARVVRQYFHTTAGFEAALVLAQMEIDQGHRVAAEQLYRELIDTPRAAARFEPQLSILAAMNEMAAGKQEAAVATLRSLLERRPGSEIMLSGSAARAPAAGSDLLAWLTQFARQPSVAIPTISSWLTQRGDATRNAQTTGGRPHLRARWQARVVNDPTLESYLTARSADYAQRGIVAMPSARPIAVGDVIVMRTPDNVVAVDWNTGKRIWETREEGELRADESTELGSQINQEQFAEQNSLLDERMWDDSLLSSLSSDGERAFVLRGVSIPQNQEMMGWPVAPGFNRMGGEGRATTNQLAAYDLATQGKLVWELDGSRAAAPLDGAFFLGAPLAIDNMLYVMAEIRSAVYILALDPATGEVRWQQQLVGLEQGIGLDPARRRAGATPSYEGGILVCPTAASAVVAIDLVKREFAWVYRYAREAQTPAEARNFWQQAGQPQIVRGNDRWLDSAAVIAEGRVFLTPPESGELHCVDLQSGKLLWKHRRGEASFVGGVHDGRVLLIEADKLRALRAADGVPAWEQEFAPLPAGTLPAGQGYLSEGHYYLPLSSGEIADVELATGKVSTIGSAQHGSALGNLISYRGSILSQSALVVDKFEQLAALQQRAEAALAKNPDDATALRELAELKRADGNTQEAVTLLKRAYELAPDDVLAQDMLTEMLLAMLAADYAKYREDVPLLSSLIRDRDQQIELLRLEATGLDDGSDPLTAWNAYLRLADYLTEAPVFLQIGGDYRVRSDRWISGRLKRLWSRASSTDREALLARLAERRPSTENPRTAAEMRHYLAHLDAMSGAGEVRLALAKFLIDRGRTQEAEIELLELRASAEAESMSDADALLQELSTEADDGAIETRRPWPRGKVDAQLFPVATRTVDRAAPAHVERQAGFRQLRIEQDFSGDASPIQWLVTMDCSELVGRNALGDDVFHLAVDQNNLARQHRDSGFVYAGRLGHLLYVALGGQIMAIDSRGDGLGTEGTLVWQTESPGRLSIENIRGRRVVIMNTTTRSSRRPIYHAWSGRKRISGAITPGVSSLGPVTPRGVVFQENNELKCVDPLSGEPLWTRSDVPSGCELFGDKELVVAADVNERFAHVFRLVDGRSMGKRELPKHEWLLTAGRNIAELGFEMKPSGRVLLLRISDIWSKEVLYEFEYPITARFSVVEPGAIAVYEPSGRFHYIDAHSGKLLIDKQLQVVPDMQFIQAMRAGNEVFLFVSGPPQQQFKPISQFDNQVINGYAYAFSLKSGNALWPQPAVVRNRGIVLSQPADIPLLVFAERKSIRDASTGGGAQLRVLCLDRRTGQTVYRNDSLPDTSITRFRIRAEQDAEPRVALEMSTGKIELAMTDRPRPPQPPGNDDLESPRENTERGLRGIGRRIGEVLRGTITDDQTEIERRRRLAPAQQPQPALDDD